MSLQSLLGGIALAQAIPPTVTFLRSAVCLSVVCHIRAPCLKRSTDLYAIWQVKLWGPITHCVTWGPLPTREGEICGRTSSQNMQLQIAAATWQIETRAIPHFTKLLWCLLLLVALAVI